MAKAVKMADIAAIMGVSTVTVSKALSDQKGVSEELRIKIKKKAQEMGYRTVSSLNQERAKKNASYTIGVIVADRFLDKYESFYWTLYQDVATAAVQRGCFTMLEVLQSEDENRMIMPKLLQERKTEGLVIIGRLKKDYLERLLEYASVPVFFLDFYDRDGKCDAVVSNSFFGMYVMTNYLFDMGHREIGFVGNVLATDSITDRYFGYMKSLYEHGVDVNKECPSVCRRHSCVTMTRRQQCLCRRWNAPDTRCRRTYRWWVMIIISRRGCATWELRPMRWI